MPEPGSGALAPVLEVHPSRRCNLACGHCSSASGPLAEEALPARLVLAAIRDAAALGYRAVSVSGGEPLLSPDLPAILKRARALELTTTVTTNGLLLGQRRWERIAPLVDALWVSIDGTEVEHDALRGRDGAYAHTVQNLAAARATGTPFGLTMTLTQFNASSIASVVELAAREGARSVVVRPLALTGRAAGPLDHHRPDGIELAAALIEAERLAAATGLFVHVDALTIDQTVLYRGDLVPAYPTRSLPSLAPSLVLEADGTLRPLSQQLPDGLALGSLHRASLRDLAADWLASDRARELAAACDRAWNTLTAPGAGPAAAWLDEVSLHVQPAFTGYAPAHAPADRVAVGGAEAERGVNQLIAA